MTRLRRWTSRPLRAVWRVVVATAIPVAMTVSQNLAARLDRTPGCETPARSASAGSREAVAEPPREGPPSPLSVTLASGMIVAGQIVVVRLEVCGTVEELLLPQAVAVGIESVGTLGSIRMGATWRARSVGGRP